MPDMLLTVRGAPGWHTPALHAFHDVEDRADPLLDHGGHTLAAFDLGRSLAAALGG